LEIFLKKGKDLALTMTDDENKILYLIQFSNLLRKVKYFACIFALPFVRLGNPRQVYSKNYP
jgi:hypothetical protein